MKANHFPVVVAEVVSGPNPGPTGRFFHVLKVEVRDYGGNVLMGPMPADDYKPLTWRNPVKLVAVEVETPASENITGDYVCDF